MLKSNDMKGKVDEVMEDDDEVREDNGGMVGCGGVWWGVVGCGGCGGV